jgi:site-specific recombinase XerD
LAEDLIERFLDATTVRQGFDRARCASQREELRSFHWWLERRHGRAITNASAADLQRYVDELQGRGLARKRAKVAAVLREFFSYLREVGIRLDEPARYLDARGICSSGSLIEAVA